MIYNRRYSRVNKLVLIYSARIQKQPFRTVIYTDVDKLTERYLNNLFLQICYFLEEGLKNVCLDANPSETQKKKKAKTEHVLLL